jgi:REase_AHJR-like
MDFEKELERIAEQYRAEGYVVITHPDADHLPGFAADFGVDLVATRGDGHVLVQVKRDRAALEADPNVPARAEVTNAQPGWRYDLVVLGPDNPVRRLLRDAREPSPEEIEQMLADAERVAQLGTLRAAFLLAWGGLEAAMRKLAQRAGLNGEIGTQPLLLVRELYSSGYLSPEDFHRLEESRVIRTEIVHGLAPPTIDAGVVEYLTRLARRLMGGSANAAEAAS